MARFITWVAEQDLRGWACSECGWTCPIPTLLTEGEAREAFDRLARAKFQDHECAQHPKKHSQSGEETFAERVKKFVARGYKPKDAVELILQEITLEHRNQPKIVEKARADAEEFLRNLRSGRV